ncbi:nitroreductase, partial [Candidatus Woesearchaeota archaeon]
METWDAIRSRRSCRKFKQQPVEWDKIGMLLEAAREAPSAGNLQTWR